MGNTAVEKDIYSKIDEAIGQFHFEGKLIDKTPYGSGHINDTFLLRFSLPDGSVKKQILQRVNRIVFKNPVEVMENIQGVTTFLRKKIIENGGDPDRETLNLRPAKDGKCYYLDADGDYWRSFGFIEGATCYDQVEKEEHFYQSAVAFGNFQCLLAEYPASALHETIAGFHDTASRFETFCQAVKDDVCGRAAGVKDEIRFVMEHQEIAHVFGDLQKAGKLPLRVTHNDTKLNNIMLDDQTGKAICVIDLDTVMPGLAMNDFGDSIRFGASTAAEDEKDLSKVSCSMELFELYAKGFLEGCAGSLTDLEVSLLPMGAKVMTYECGMRFLTDYLQGDTYFKIHRENHNLDRCRTQFKLVADMEEKWYIMEDIIKKAGS
ncbi:MAG: aminoglycoside phosphotransferase family protein [Lachnospiraceae bacterium]|nr:aminoglycoside phosphotransferase family protein [Lachnospiraceae bacterium]